MSASSNASSKPSYVDVAAATVLSNWKGDSVSDAATAAFNLGLIHSSSGTGLDKMKEYVSKGFKKRRIDDIHWSTICNNFDAGRGAVVTPEQIRKQFCPAPAKAPYFDPSVFEWSDPAEIPPRDWLYGRHLIRRHVSATIAAGAAGKTSLKIVEALALASGRPLLGIDVPKRLRVWLVNLEDDLIELRRRVSAAMIYYNIRPEDLGDRLCMDGETSLVITRTERNGTKIVQPVVDALVDAIEGREIDVLIVDPFISSHDAPESDSGAMDLVMKAGWVVVARDANCAVELCHHTTKSDAASGMATAMSGRGSGAVVFACRSVQVLNPMTPDQAKAAGLDSPVGYFSAKDDKQNLTQKSGSLDWYRMQSVSLGNGGGTGNLSFLRADDIGVVTKWHWPSKSALVDEITPEQLQKIKDRLSDGMSRKDAQAAAWAGFVVADALGLGASKETLQDADRRRMKRLLDELLSAGHLKVCERKVNRETKEFLATA